MYFPTLSESSTNVAGLFLWKEAVHLAYWIPKAEGSDRDRFIKVVDPELLLVELIDEVLQRFTPLLSHGEELSVELQSVE